MHGCNWLPKAQYTPPTPTRRNCRVSSRWRCEHNSQLAHDNCRRIRPTILKLTKQTPSRLITPILINIDNFFNNDVTMSSLLKKLSVSIKIHTVKTQKQTQTQSVWPVSKLSTESVGSRRELVANSCTHRRRDATKQVSSRRQCVLGFRH